MAIAAGEAAHGCNVRKNFYWCLRWNIEDRKVLKVEKDNWRLKFWNQLYSNDFFQTINQKCMNFSLNYNFTFTIFTTINNKPPKNLSKTSQPKNLHSSHCIIVSSLVQVHWNCTKTKEWTAKNGQRIIRGSDMEVFCSHISRCSHADDAVKKENHWHSNPNHFVSIFCRQIKVKSFHASFQRNELIESSSIKRPVSFHYHILKASRKNYKNKWGKESLKLCCNQRKKSLDWIKQINKLLRQNLRCRLTFC